MRAIDLPPSLPNLLACACPDCCRQAATGRGHAATGSANKTGIMHWNLYPPTEPINVLRSSGKLIEAMKSCWAHRLSATGSACELAS